MNGTGVKKELSLFGDIRVMCFAAMLVALSIAIAAFCKVYLSFGAIRVTFENLPILLSGVLFGPLVGAATGVTADIISCIIAANPISPIITVGAAMVGAVSGTFSHYIFKKYSTTRVFVSTLAAHVLGSMLIKSAGLMIYYNFPFETIIWRVPLYLFIWAVESSLIAVLLKNPIILRVADIRRQTK
ncbi:MAG: folate family ECF transporter S component [Clostridiales bacterium]|nr:folate family ECF transporter S component [Clostridiales bacterium]